jgi:P-type Ca2+ transporter type 2C
MISGLSDTQAAAQLKTFGYNELPSAKPKNIWKIALEVVQEPMFILLISCGLLYILLKDYSEGIILLCWVFSSSSLHFFNTEKQKNHYKP